MDIKDGFATSSKEHLRSLVRVHELDEITSNGAEDRSPTRITPGDWNAKDRTSCEENHHLGREDDIIKIMQVEGSKSIITWGPTGAKGRPNRAEVGPGRPAQAGRPWWPVWPPFPCTRRIFNPKTLEAPPSTGGEPFAPEAIHKLERERRRISGGRSATSKEAPSHGEEGRQRRKGNHDQQCYVQHLDGVIFLFVHGL
jgi:hypothetical protein